MTVLHEGLDICTFFADEQTQQMIPVPVQGMVHGASVHNKEVIAYFVRTLLSSP